MSDRTKAMTNIILIGMPASGKSTVGVVLAKILGYDLSTRTCSSSGRPAAASRASYGTAA